MKFIRNFVFVALVAMMFASCASKPNASQRQDELDAKYGVKAETPAEQAK